LQRWLEKKSDLQAEKVGERLGRIAFKVSGKHRKLAFENVTRAFPDLPERERWELARNVMVHFARVMCDFMRARVRTSEQVLASCTVEGFEHIERAREAGKGALLVAAHFGNWERMAHAISALGVPLSVVSRDANDPEMNALVNELRHAAGVQLISRGDAAFPTLKRLKKNECVGLLPDQNSDEIFVPFFGVPCGTVTGPAVLSLRAEAPLIPIYTARVGPGKYRFWVEPPLQPEPGFEPVEGLTRAINSSLEAAIRQYPDQYLWIHNRWKSAKRRGLV
jgi:KDO2-lipid IV(A) lauroyltransferase